MLHPVESKTDSMLLNAEVTYKKRRKCPTLCPCSPLTLLPSKKYMCCGTTLLWAATSLVTYAIGYYIKAEECLRDGSLSEEL
jgi:hypothetical protein